MHGCIMCFHMYKRINEMPIRANEFFVVYLCDADAVEHASLVRKCCCRGGDTAAVYTKKYMMQAFWGARRGAAECCR